MRTKLDFFKNFFSLNFQRVKESGPQNQKI